MSKYKGVFGNITMPEDWQDAADAVKRAGLTLDDEESIERVVHELSHRMYIAFIGIGEPEEMTEITELVTAGLMPVKVWSVMVASGIWPYVAADLAAGYGLEFGHCLRQWRRV